MKLSVLDQSPVSEGSSPAEALRNTIELARLADQLGFERYWVAEHHGMDTLACTAPEVLLARLGAETQRIRLGSGAILLPHYSPFKVAESFRMLHALYPDRIDLGIGRAPGGTQTEARALRKGQDLTADDFPERLLELLAFLRQGFPADHPFRNLRVSPDTPGNPDVWLLGSSSWSALAAAKLGLPYAFAHFIDPQSTREAIELYRSEFRPSTSEHSPRMLLALGIICAPTQEEADFLAASSRAVLRRFRTFPRSGGRIPTPQDALKELSSGLDPAMFDTGEWRRYIVGDPASIRASLNSIAAELNIDEIMAITIVHGHEQRLRSYRLLSEAFEVASDQKVEFAHSGSV